MSTFHNTIEQPSDFNAGSGLQLRAWLTENAWYIWLFIGIFTFGASLAFSQTEHSLLEAGYNGAAIIAVVFGVLLHRPAHATIWYLVAGSLGVHFGSEIVQIFVEQGRLSGDHFTTVGRALYLAQYPLLTIALLRLIYVRTRRHDRASLIDATIVATGLLLLIWAVLIKPAAVAPDMSIFDRLLAVSYPAMDVMMIGVVTRLALAPGRRNPALLMLISVSFCVIVINLVVSYLKLRQPSGAMYFSDPGWIMIFIGWGAIALHPSMPHLAHAASVSDTDTRLTPQRLILLAAASLLVPATLALQVHLKTPIDIPLIGSASTVLFLLLLVRMNGLIRMLTTVLATVESSANREHILRKASTTLVTATTQDEIWTATLETVHALRGESPAGVVAVATGSITTMRVIMVAGHHSAGAQNAIVDLEQFSPEVREHLHNQELVEVILADYPRLWRLLGGDPEAKVLLLAPLMFQQTFQALILVTSDEPILDEFWGGIEALSAQIVLALDSVALASERHRRRGEERFRSLVQFASDIVSVVDEEGIIRYESPAVQRILGYVPEQLIGMSTLSLVHPDDAVLLKNFYQKVSGSPNIAPTVELRLRHRNNSWIHVEIAGSNLLHDPNVNGVVLNTRDISERKRFEEELHHQAFHDPLTNLPNRALFMARLEHSLTRPHRHPQSLAIIFLDLDGFKYVNDTLGHEVGDQLLVAVAERLRGCMRPGDTAARFGGDEFTILIEDIENEHVAIEVADQIITRMQAPFAVRRHEMFVTASIGIALNTTTNDGPVDLLRYADTAMYAAKLSGKGQYKLFDTSMGTAAWERLELEYDLRLAIERDEFKVYYQPLVTLGTGQISGMEALIRWEHPRRGMISPGHFIPLAEETGLIVQIGQWVLDRACRQARTWQLLNPDLPPLEISVNLSARQFQLPDLVENVARVLRDSSLPPHCLKLEITESDVMVDAEATIRKLHELKKLGIKLAIDDFGTGYSSLTYLKRFPIDTLKIDKAFVSGIVNSAEDLAIVQTVTTLAHTLALSVTAEGVETDGVASMLRTIGCEIGQGYFFSRPVPTEAAGALLRKHEQPFTFGTVIPELPKVLKYDEAALVPTPH